MEPEKSKSPITSKHAFNKTTRGKSETVDDDKAALIKASKLPAYLQRRSITSDEEEKKEQELKKQMAAGKVAIVQKK